MALSVHVITRRAPLCYAWFLHLKITRMASIVPVGKRFRALIARRGVRVSRTFDTRSEANAWAARREHEILTGTSPAQIDARLTLHKVFIRFRDEDAQKRRGCRWEVTRLNRFLREFEDIPLTKLGAGQFSAWRNAKPRFWAALNTACCRGWGETWMPSASPGSMAPEMSSPVWTVTPWCPTESGVSKGR